MRNVLYLMLVGGLLASSIIAVAEPKDKTTKFSAADEQPNDRIVRQVRHELLMIPQLTVFDDLSYKVEGDTVTLMGEVRNPVIKDEAQWAVKRIEGVEQIKNEIEILPVSFNDDLIRRQVARAIFREPRLFEYAEQPVASIHIIVKRGHVDLEGVVSSQSDKDVAGIRANEVPGVFSVQNDLRVEDSKVSRK